MNIARVDLRNALLCSAIALVALLFAWPFANLPFNDDWTWAFTVKQLHITGHLVYNGWSSPSVIAQAYWGLLWVKVFGFSFNVLRASSIPMSVAAVGICYLLGRQARLTAGMSMFVAMSLGLSPLYMPLESTFMSDAPGLFFMLLSLYAIVRGFDSQSIGSSIGWLIFGAIAALVGGSSRQVVWIVPLVVLPYFTWLRRENFRFVITAFLGWMIVLTGAYAMQHWFAQQPYALPDPPLRSYVSIAVHHPKQFVIDIVHTVLTLTIVLLPAVFGAIYRPWLPVPPDTAPPVLGYEGAIHRPSPAMRYVTISLIATVLTLGIWEVVKRLHPPVEPWMGNVFTSTGPLGSIEIAGSRPAFQSDRVKRMVSIVVIFGLSLLNASAALWVLQNWRGLWRKIPAFSLRSQGVHPVIPAMLLLVAALFGLEMTRWVSGVAYDRHLLPFIPFIAIPLLLAYQQSGMKRMPIWSWALLALFGIIAIAATQEVNSLARARVQAIDKLKANGILANQIDAGFEHDYWTELELDGHINDARIANPPNTYNNKKGPTPAMQIVYRLESKPTAVTETTLFGTVEYFSLLPPFHNTIYIDEFKDRWWLDPAKASTRPAEKSLLPQVLLDQYKSK